MEHRNTETRDHGTLSRFHRALGPIAGGVMIDLVDLATFGPIGIVLGLVFGGGIGWWVGSIYRFSPGKRVLWALVCGIYCTIPFTAIFPVMTIISAVARFGEDPGPPANGVAKGGDAPVRP